MHTDFICEVIEKAAWFRFGRQNENPILHKDFFRDEQGFVPTRRNLRHVATARTMKQKAKAESTTGHSQTKKWPIYM